MRRSMVISQDSSPSGRTLILIGYVVRHEHGVGCIAGRVAICTAKICWGKLLVDCIVSS